MPSKKQKAHNKAVLTAHQAGAHLRIGCTPHIPWVAPHASHEDKQLAQAIRASLDCASRNEENDAALEKAISMSRAEAAERDEAVRLAIEASLVESQQNVLSLGLGLTAGSSRGSAWIRQKTVNISILPGQTSECASNHAIALSAAETVAETNALPPAQAKVEAAAQATPVTAAATSHVLKVTHGDDTRRLRADWHDDAPVQRVLASIQAAVAEGFGLVLGSAAPPATCFKYYDDEGDLCTLVDKTVKDFLEMTPQGSPLKIVLDLRPQKERANLTVAKFDCLNVVQSEVFGEKEQLENLGVTTEKLEEKLEGLEDFSIATPPSTPRSEMALVDNQTIEDAYDSMWSLVEQEADAAL